MRTIIYLRAADAPDQADIRLLNLQDTSAARRWTVAGTHVDRVIGTTKGRNRLPGLAAMLNAVARDEVDVVMVWSLHHLGTSVDTLLDTLAELHRHGVKLVVHDQPDDGSTVDAGGLLTAADMLVDARRAYRRENIIAGQLRARATGVRFGRPPIPSTRIEKVRLALRSGQGVRQAARTNPPQVASKNLTSGEIASAVEHGWASAAPRFTRAAWYLCVNISFNEMNGPPHVINVHPSLSQERRMTHLLADNPLPDEEPVTALREMVERLCASPGQLIDDLRNATWSSISGGVAGELWWELIAATQIAKDAAQWLAVRRLGICIHNEHRETWTALTLTLGLLVVPGRGRSLEVSNTLANDRAWLEQELGIADVTRAGSVKAKLNVVARLIALADDPSTIANLRNLRQRLVRERRKKILGCAIMAMIVVSNGLGAASRTNTPPQPTTYPATTYNASLPPSLPIGQAFPSIPGTMSPPQPTSARPAALGLNLEKPELRWCIYQSVRIAAAQIIAHGPNATPATLSQFNQITDNWNAVCSHYRYRESDGEQMIREVVVWRDALEREGRSLLAITSSPTAIGSPSGPTLISPPS